LRSQASEELWNSKRLAHEIIGAPRQASTAIVERRDNDADVIPPGVTPKASEHLAVPSHNVAVDHNHIGNDSLDVRE
jgi:hypothetical protein